jgi:hypothetical protein
MIPKISYKLSKSKRKRPQNVTYADNLFLPLALLAAKNKWLIGHPEGGLPEGSYIGLTGENLEIK